MATLSGSPRVFSRANSRLVARWASLQAGQSFPVNVWPYRQTGCLTRASARSRCTARRWAAPARQPDEPLCGLPGRLCRLRSSAGRAQGRIRWGGGRLCREPRLPPPGADANAGVGLAGRPGAQVGPHLDPSDVAADRDPASRCLECPRPSRLLRLRRRRAADVAATPSRCVLVAGLPARSSLCHAASVQSRGDGR
jgi:hypothetical protein